MIHGTSQTWNPDFLEQFPEFSSDLSHVTRFVLTTSPAAAVQIAHTGKQLDTPRGKIFPRHRRTGLSVVFVRKCSVFRCLWCCEGRAEPQNGLGWKRFLKTILSCHGQGHLSLAQPQLSLAEAPKSPRTGRYFMTYPGITS